MLFPVLIGHGVHFTVTYFSLFRRKKRDYIVGDSLFLSLGESDPVFRLLRYLAEHYFSSALDIQIDWLPEEKSKIASQLHIKPKISLDGDSWNLPLFLALYCYENGKDWPLSILASGAIRRCRGMRCVSIGRALHKLRLARRLGKLCMLPISNARRLKKLHPELDGCLGLPYNLEHCLKIWASYVS